MTFSRSDGDLRRRRSWIQRRGEPAPEAAPPAFLTAAEAQTVADTDPIALRALLLPDYDGVANAFSKLLLRVVRRCKWDGQVEGRVLHACEALGVPEGRPVLVGALAKRLRGFGLAWHSFTIEECQAFVEQELDTDEDGRVGVSDIFALLCTLQPPHRAQRASRNTAKHSSRRRATLRSDFRIGVRRPRETRRQAAVAAGMLATRNFPRGLQQKLLTAAGLARSCGVNVLKALQEGVYRSSSSSSSSRAPVGAEATCLFFRNIGVNHEDFGGGSNSSSIATKDSSGHGPDRTRSESLEDLLCRRNGHNKLSRREEMGFPGCAGDGLFFPGRTRAEPWSASRDQYQVQEGGGTQEGRGCPRWDTPATRTWRHPPDPKSKSGGYGPNTPESLRLHGDFPYRCSPEKETFGECPMDAGGASDDRPQEEKDTRISRRLRRAAEDLKRMKAEYAALEQQIRGGVKGAGSMQQPPLPPPPPPLSSPPTSAQTEDDSADDATMTATNNNDNATSHPYNNRPRSSFCHGHNNTTTSRPYNERPRSSFCHGHSNPRHDGAYHFFFRRKHGEQHQPRASTGLDEERKGSRGKEERGINKEQEKEEHNDHHRCHDESQLRNDHRGRIQERFGWWLRPSSVSSSPPPPPPPMGTKPAPGATAIAAASSSSTAFVRDEATNFRYRPPSFSGWPRHAPDTRRCRALLLMAAQGKSSREEVFDLATPHNGFSRIQKHQAFGFGEGKGCRKPELGRTGRDAVMPRNSCGDRGTDGERGRSSRRGCRIPVTTPGVHPFLCATEAERRTDGFVTVSEEGRTIGCRDHTPERRPARPPAIKSPSYARCRSEERNVWDKASGRWKRSRAKQNCHLCGFRGHSVDSSTRARGPGSPKLSRGRPAVRY